MNIFFFPWFDSFDPVCYVGLVCPWVSFLRFSPENSWSLKKLTLPNINAELYQWILKLRGARRGGAILDSD